MNEDLVLGSLVVDEEISLAEIEVFDHAGLIDDTLLHPIIYFF